MRRILRKIAAGEEDSIGDVSTLADPSVRAVSGCSFALFYFVFILGVAVVALILKVTYFVTY